MSVLFEISIFPTDKGASVSAYVAPVVKLIKDSGLPCKLTAMGTIILESSVDRFVRKVSQWYV